MNAHFSPKSMGTKSEEIGILAVVGNQYSMVECQIWIKKKNVYSPGRDAYLNLNWRTLSLVAV